MIFSTVLFLFGFFPVFFLIYFLMPHRYKNAWALFGSILFYFWGAPKFTPIVLVSLVLDWHLSKLIYQGKTPAEKKYYLFLQIVFNVGLLAYFKYANFFMDNLAAFYEFFKLPAPGKWVEVLLPIGISFITFEKITYCVDVYRGVTKPADRLSSYFLYIFLFPHLVAGPIIQYHELARKIVKRSHNYYNFRYGLFRFSLGLVKKVWIADVVAQAADSAFGMPTSALNPQTAWLGILCYALQIYFDFSGYADMAIGMMRIMGFKINENFNMPYISQSITEFWRRWHMSLGRWMRAYLYIPLGGNRVPAWRVYFNLVFVFFISGLWHGASWTFVFWGMYHGLFLLFDRAFWLNQSAKWPRWVNVVFTFFVVLVGWVFFRASTFPRALQYLGSMFDVSRWGVFHPANQLLLRPELAAIFILGMVLIWTPLIPGFRKLADRVGFGVRSKYVMEAASVALLVLAMAKVSTASFSPFIYFRF